MPMLMSCSDRARGQPVAADLLARERGLLQQQDVEPGLREVVRGGRAGGTGADDDDVGGLADCLLARSRLISPAWMSVTSRVRL